MKNTIVIIFSKDRAMQLRATIDSFCLQCSDSGFVDAVVLYKTSSEEHRRQYNQLIENYGVVKFVEETIDLVTHVLEQCSSYKFVVFVVDDTVFVNKFEILAVERNLSNHKEAVGFSLRLGGNVNYCYALSRPQKIPPLVEVEPSIFMYRWVGAECDWGYPLEVSSSVYRVEEVVPFIESGLRGGPGEIEGSMAARCNVFMSTHPSLLCYCTSRAFSVPLNIVRPTKFNRAGDKDEYSVGELAKRFEEGYKIDIVLGLDSFCPVGVHQEVDFHLIKV